MMKSVYKPLQHCARSYQCIVYIEELLSASISGTLPAGRDLEPMFYLQVYKGVFITSFYIEFLFKILIYTFNIILLTYNLKYYLFSL